MKKFVRFIAVILSVFALAFALGGCAGAHGSSSSAGTSSVASAASSACASASTSSDSYADQHLKSASSVTREVHVTRDGEYTDCDSVALYIHKYGRVPSNYVTKTKARKAGWVASEGNLWDVLPGKSIGGGGFYNDDGMMPDAPGREWFECDIDYTGGFRNAKRLVYSNDGLIYYTNDHYKTFTRLY